MFVTLVVWLLSVCACVWAGGMQLPGAHEAVSVTLPDFGRQLREFERSDHGSVGWWPHLVDTVWFESGGLSTYDIFKYGWYNAWGTLRFEIGRAMTRGERPLMFMTRFHKKAPDIVEHEMAEECAGGGVLFVDQKHCADDPELLAQMEDYFRFRHQHRAIFAYHSKRRYAQIAVVYSVPTMMYHAYQYSTAEPINALSGLARALEEGHLPYDIAILNHPEIHEDAVTAEDLRRYRLVIMPAIECIAQRQVKMLIEYLRDGGTVAVIGECGVRDEDNRRRDRSVLEELKKAGRVVEMLPEHGFFGPRVTESEQTRQVSRAVIQQVETALGGDTLLQGDLPRMLWVKTWQHNDQFVSLHFVNYDIDFESGEATSTGPIDLSIRLPEQLRAEQAAWMVPGQKTKALEMQLSGRTTTVTIPAVDVYGVLVIGREGLDEMQSAILRGDALFARAKMASAGKWPVELEAQASEVESAANRCGKSNVELAEAQEYARSAADLLQETQEFRDRAYLHTAQQAVDAGDAMMALDFGADAGTNGWLAVAADDEYAPETGYGWLPVDDESKPTPEELYYDMADRHGEKFVADRVRHHILFWPYQQPPPSALRYSICCGTPHRFRVDVPAGEYVIRVVTTNPSWTNRNFIVSGMVSANGAFRLFDAAHDCGAIVARRFRAVADDGALQFTFGGPTGWAVSAIVIEPAEGSADPEDTIQALREWRVSPRYANTGWYPIRQTSTTVENQLVEPKTDEWQLARSPEQGLPVMDLGTNGQADVGDTVYAVATIESPNEVQRQLHFAASSQAQLWLNGEEIGYVPNEKGVRRDEFGADLDLRAGQNTLLVKLQRFWERHWMFAGYLAE